MFNHSNAACETNLCASFGVLLHAEPITRNELFMKVMSDGKESVAKTNIQSRNACEAKRLGKRIITERVCEYAGNVYAFPDIGMN